MQQVDILFSKSKNKTSIAWFNVIDEYFWEILPIKNNMTLDNIKKVEARLVESILKRVEGKSPTSNS